MSEKGKINPKNGKGQGQRFGIEKPAIPGPGRPRLSEEVRAERKEAREILKAAAPRFAQRIVELSESRDDHTAIAALKVGLDKVLPNLEEVENFEHRPLQQLTDEQIDAKLAQINAGAASTTPREGEAA